MVYFLDIDGVLNCEKDWKHPFTINNGCLAVFKELLRWDSSPYIVLSSTWRNGFDKNGRGNNETGSIFRKAGLVINDVTPSAPGKTRQEEIEYYIRRNSVGKYIVLDDDLSLFPSPDKINIYVTDYKTGLTKRDIKAIRKMMGG